MKAALTLVFELKRKIDQFANNQIIEQQFLKKMKSGSSQEGDFEEPSLGFVNYPSPNGPF